MINISCKGWFSSLAGAKAGAQCVQPPVLPVKIASHIVL